MGKQLWKVAMCLLAQRVFFSLGEDDAGRVRLKIVVNTGEASGTHCSATHKKRHALRLEDMSFLGYDDLAGGAVGELFGLEVQHPPTVFPFQFDFTPPQRNLRVGVERADVGPSGR